MLNRTLGTDFFHAFQQFAFLVAESMGFVNNSDTEGYLVDHVEISN